MGDRAASGPEFRRWVEAGFRHYGEDPWFFLRELAQNSRDAGAAQIRVRAGRTATGMEFLVFDDDGAGMGFDHARKFLFRLYASSKTADRFAAGMFGIGFWTVLRFHPHAVTVESKTRKEAWAVRIDAGLEITPAACTLDQTGTRVRLERRPHFDGAAAFQRAVAERLDHYCRHLRRNDAAAIPLPLTFNGGLVSKPFALPGAITRHFRKGMVEGVVGLGEHPQVRLYARGLPVWEGASLDDLSHVHPQGDGDFEVGRGLAPVFLLNGNNLNVNMNRREVLDNPALRRLQRIAKEEMNDLIDVYAARAHPAGIWRRLSEGPRRVLHRLRRSVPLRIAAIILISVPLTAGLFLLLFAKAGSQPETGPGIHNPLGMDRELPYRGPEVMAPSTPVNLGFTYRPPAEIWFRLFNAETYDPVRGFVPDPASTSSAVAAERGGTNGTVHIRLSLKGSDRILLPRPADHVLAAGSLRLDGFPWSGRLSARAGGVVATVPPGSKWLEYRCRAEKDPPATLGDLERIRLTSLPSSTSDSAILRDVLSGIDNFDSPARVRKAAAWLRSRLQYDASRATARAFRGSDDGRPWLKRVIDIGRGDCDVLNGVLVLVLRRMGIPARLVIGAVGKQGTSPPFLHAWTEYFANGWRRIDISRYVASTRREDTAPTSAASEPPGEAPSWHLGLLLLISVCLCLSPLVFLRYRRRSRTHLSGTGGSRIREDLARIALGAMVQPRAWRDATRIWHAPILPTLGGKPMSLRRALGRGRRRTVILGCRQNPLAVAIARAGVPVLDRGDATFDALLRLLPEAIDLDRLQVKNPRPPDTADPATAALLTAANRRIHALGIDLPFCLWSVNHHQEDPQVVRFPVRRRRWRRLSRILFGAAVPPHLAVIGPKSRRLRDLVPLHRRHPSMALARLLEYLVGECHCSPRREAKIRRKIAAAWIRETRA